MTRIGPLLYNRNDVYIGRSLEKYGDYSLAEANLFRQLLRQGMTAIDAGANIGVHTVLLSQLVGPRGNVIAYEPQRLVFQTLCANLALNQCTNVRARNAGVADNAGSARVPVLSPERKTNFGRVSLDGTETDELVSVVTIDAEELTACDLLKIDVEGWELRVLRGAAWTIRQCQPVIYVENDRRDRSPELISALLELDYRLYWHICPLFSQDNFNQDMDNVFPGIVTVNLVCLPQSSHWKVDQFLRPVSGTDDWWQPPPEAESQA